MQPDGLYLALLNKTIHRAEQYRPLFLAAGREHELAGLSEDVSSPTQKFTFIVLTTMDCVPAELESKMCEVSARPWPKRTAFLIKRLETLTDFGPILHRSGQ